MSTGLSPSSRKKQLTGNIISKTCINSRAGDEDDSDDHKEHGRTYVKTKCGYKMVVYEDKEPPTGICDTDTAKKIIDDAVDGEDDEDDIKDAIKDALDDQDMEYSFLLTFSNPTENTFVSLGLEDSCVVHNAQAYLYLYA